MGRGVPTPSWLARGRRGLLVVAVVTLLAGPALAGCSAVSPECARGDDLVRAGQLDQAAAQYAVAARSGASGCADDGLRRIAELRSAGAPASPVAPATIGAAATPAAAGAPAAAGVRAGVSPTPSAGPQQPVGPISAAAENLGFWVAFAAIVALAVVVATAAWVAAEGRRRVEVLELRVLELTEQLAGARERADSSSEGVVRLEADTERLRAQVTANGARVATERARADHILDLLGALPPADVVVTEHYGPAPGEPEPGAR